ncbi:phosphoribosylanthranilate isomerase [cyanobiont of Ornithocercus magnificus]|nr:phosphoribosylanthranilate isomerase [cyanobiont of Ornithocercus magnificus]
MARINLKICGLTDTDQSLAIAAMGVDAIGVIGVPGSPRYLNEQRRRDIFLNLEHKAPSLERVWVVANPADAELEQALNGKGQPTVVQLHGGETVERSSELRWRYGGVRWWKALRIKQKIDVGYIQQFRSRVDALLLDAWSPRHLGGTGYSLPVDWLEDMPLDFSWWLAGGVSAERVSDILTHVRPEGLDASSRLEIRPGWKDLAKVRRLVDAVRTHQY